MIGRKNLAGLVYANDELSPLNIASDLFLPSSVTEISEEQVTKQLTLLQKHREIICKLAHKDKLGRFSVWHHNDTINQLFWKNLISKERKNFVWRSKHVQEWVREFFECE